MAYNAGTLREQIVLQRAVEAGTDAAGNRILRWEPVCVMYKSYTAKGRNHLSVHYEKEILGLPDKPEDVGRKDE